MEANISTALVNNSGSAQPPKAAKFVAQRIRDQILAGRYPVGTALPDVQSLTTTFRVSRPTLREALNLLEASGFIKLKRGPRGGAVVQEPDGQHVLEALSELLMYLRAETKDVLEVRLILEPSESALACDRATPEDLARLQACIDRQWEVIDDDAGWFDANFDFHCLLAGASKNPVLRILTESLHQLVRLAGTESSYSHEDRVMSTKQHEEMVAAIAAGDPDKARAAHESHVRTTRLGRMSQSGL